MRRVRYLAVPLVAAAVAAGIPALAATSAPEWYKGGKPLEGTVAFTSKSTTGAPLLEGAGGLSKVKCASSESKGELSGPTGIKALTVTYEGCKEGTMVCQSATTAGQIVTHALNGENIYLNKLHTLAGELLRPASGEIFAEFKCGSEETTLVKGEVIGQSTPLAGAESVEGQLTFEQEAGAQRYQGLEGKAEKRHVVAFASFAEAGLGGGTKGEPLIETVKFGSAVQLHKS
jgi:hypothetical protein